jgi:peptidase M28-like protein
MKYGHRVVQTRAFALVTLLFACSRPPQEAVSPIGSKARALLEVLAADSLGGRGTGTEGANKAAWFIASRMEGIGLRPAGDSGYYQRVPLVFDSVPDASGRRRLALVERSDGDGRVIVPATNLVSLLPGTDPVLRHEAVVVGAHYDHLGTGTPVAGDSIYNGADDDGSGVVAMLEIARMLASGPPPRRSVIFLATTGEEGGLLGTRYYIDHPAVPLENTVADLQIEMIGRPDSLAGGVGKGWLTGFERSTMGDQLAAAGIPIVPDPRPEQNFFERSDNIAFALRGIPAHTLSSFGMHRDYHQPSDEVSRIHWEHLTQVISAAAKTVRLLADGPAPAWKPDGRPQPPGSSP